MPTQKLLLNWKDHNGALVSVFENLLKNNILVDCTLAAEGQYLKAHKVVLSACSSYFELLFSQESEKNPIVILKDVKFQELEAAINFMYSGEVEVCEDRLGTFLEVADSLQIKGLGSNRKSQDSKEKLLSVKSSVAKLALTQWQQSKKEDSNLPSDNTGQSSNVLADCELIRNYENSSASQLSQRENTPTLTVTTINAGSSPSPVRKEIRRDLDSLENIRQSLALPSFTCGESVQCEDNRIIKIEPETVTYLEDQSDEAERDFGSDVLRLDDQDDWDEPNTETMNAVPTSQQNIDYSSEHMMTEDGTSEKVESIQSGNHSSSEGAGWTQSNDHQHFSSMLMKKEPGTSASWNQETVDYGDSASGDVAGPSAGTSTASAGVGSRLMDDNEQLTPGSGQILAPVAGGSSSNVSGKSADASLQQSSARPPSKKFFCPKCKNMFVRMLDLQRHVRSQNCGALPGVSGGDRTSVRSSSPQPVILPGTTDRVSFKCSECSYVTSIRSNMRRHLHTHSGLKPFKCSHCDYASQHKWCLKQHLRTHTGERPYKCQQCDYAAGQRNNLVQHMKTHDGERTFKCQHCNYSSIWELNVIDHVRIHLKEKCLKRKVAIKIPGR